ncbi:MAG: transposase [Candidatus Omnitrophica bacterium]|nr:transposase [Candidatus Omnitrophota bacterium]
MRKKVFTLGDFVHVYNRGNRKQPIFRELYDYWRFLQTLYYFNNDISIANPFRSLKGKSNLTCYSLLSWPTNWPPQKPLVKIIAFSLMKNHFHFLLKEIKESGIVSFVHKLGTGMARYFNTKYQEVGGLFQGRYKAARIDNDKYLQYLSVYIQVKNPFELYPGGFCKAIRNFDMAFEWAAQHPYCSLGDYAGKRNSPLIDKDLLGEMFGSPGKYKKFAKDCMLSVNFREKLSPLVIDE